MVNFSDIELVAEVIAAKFRPQRIILFVSYAYGKPTEDSDVDLLILVRGKRVHDRAIRIREMIDFPFPVDLVVRSVDEFKQRIGWGDWFLIKIAEDGVILHESPDTPPHEKGKRLTAKLVHATKRLVQEAAKQRERAKASSVMGIPPAGTVLKRTRARRP